eukprot:g2878.t1
MARLAGVVVLMWSDVARALGLRPGSSTDPPLPDSSVPPESPYPSYADAHAFGPPMGGAAGSSYAGSPSELDEFFGLRNWLVLRAPFTGGETRLPALPKETVQQLRGRLAVLYPASCFGDPSIHVDFRRVANYAVSEAVASGDVDSSGVSAGFLSGDDRVVRGSPSRTARDDRTTVLQYEYSKTPAAPPDEEPHAEKTENTDARGQVVVRAALTGDVKRLPAIPQETIQALRVRLADWYPETFGDLSTHVNFWREAKDAVVDEASPSEEEAVDRADVDSSGVSVVGFLRGDDLVVRGSASGTTVLQYAKTKAPPGVFEGLEKWLKEVGLEKYLTEANTWLHETGADDYTAIFEQLPAFCDALKMKLQNNKALKTLTHSHKWWRPLRRRINEYMVEAGRPERCS